MGSNLKEILYNLCKSRKNSEKNEKILARFYRNIPMITHSLSIQFFYTSTPSGCTSQSNIDKKLKLLLKNKTGHSDAER